jgi:hypothetical protein
MKHGSVVKSLGRRKGGKEGKEGPSETVYPSASATRQEESLSECFTYPGLQSQVSPDLRTGQIGKHYEKRTPAVRRGALFFRLKRLRQELQGDIWAAGMSSKVTKGGFCR